MPIKKVTTKQLAKTKSLTKEQWDQLIDAEDKVTDVRRILDDLKGEENISTIMFEIGRAFTAISDSETILSEILYTDNDDIDSFVWRK